MTNKTNHIFKGKYVYAIGKRKTASAKIRLYPGTGKVYVNNKEAKANRDGFLKPLKITGNINKFDVSAYVEGGGKASWLGAINLGIARALIKYDKNYRQTLKKQGLLKRDPRKKERKKPGLKKARRAPQWQKR